MIMSCTVGMSWLKSQFLPIRISKVTYFIGIHCLKGLSGQSLKKIIYLYHIPVSFKRLAQVGSDARSYASLLSLFFNDTLAPVSKKTCMG